MRFVSALSVAIVTATSLVAAQAPAKAPKSRATSAAVIEPQAISGLASSGRNCIGPAGANVHAIGWVPGNSRVTISFSSDFDPVASVTNTQLGIDAPDLKARSAYWADDDGGGNLEPLLNFTTTFSGTLVLHVSKFSAERAAGCYFYKVEIITG
ncbi:MAG TPA: hypothetical protein VFZ31_10250 [Vicinamibacterales bacterium]